MAAVRKVNGTISDLLLPGVPVTIDFLKSHFLIILTIQQH